MGGCRNLFGVLHNTTDMTSPSIFILLPAAAAPVVLVQNGEKVVGELLQREAGGNIGSWTLPVLHHFLLRQRHQCRWSLGPLAARLLHRRWAVSMFLAT